MSIFEKYDLADVDESFPIPDQPKEGLILLVGSSGSGKTTILNNWFGSTLSIKFNNQPIYRNFSTPENAEKYLLACGLRTVPAWKRKASDISNGERHRAECALVLDKGLNRIDEFTSVVDRNTAKALSYALQKYYRESLKKLVVASCHRDIIPWLNPDFIYDTDAKLWVDNNRRGLLWRPKIEIKIRSVEGKTFWPIFKRHHYLDGALNKSSSCFVGFCNGCPVVFVSVLAFPNAHFNNGWRGHRTIVLPEFQGLGIGSRVADTIAQYIIDNNKRFFSKTAHPAFGEYRNRSPLWKATSKNGRKRHDYKEERKTKEDKHKMKHKSRLCYSHEYMGIIKNAK